MPVGIMCFTGLSVHYPAIVTLLEDSPHTEVIIDHFGFFVQGKIVYSVLHERIYRRKRWKIRESRREEISVLSCLVLCRPASSLLLYSALLLLIGRIHYHCHCYHQAVQQTKQPGSSCCPSPSTPR
jgi:hypothetical protein